MDPADSTSAAIVLQHLGGYTQNFVHTPQQGQGQALGGQQQNTARVVGALGIQQPQGIQSHQQGIHQQQQQPFGGMTAPAVNVTSTANSTSRMSFNEKQIKRRTKTGCMTCRKRRIKCDEAKPTCFNCQKSRRECEGYQARLQDGSSGSASQSPPLMPQSSFPSSEYSTPSTLSAQTSSGFSPINQRRLGGSPRFGAMSPRFSPYDVYPRTPIEQQDLSSSLSSSKQFDPLSGNEYLATDFANDFIPDLTHPHASLNLPDHTGLSSLGDDPMVDDSTLQMSMSTPPPTARISIDSLLNLSSAALIHPPIDAPLNALFSPTTHLLPSALMKPYNAGLFAHWINILSQAMATLDRHPTDSSVLEGTPGIHYPSVRVPHEDSVYSFLIPHIALAPTGTAVLHALLACAASHRGERILGMKHYHLAHRAVKEDTEQGTTYFVAVTLLGMYEVLGGKGIRCMYIARDWILQHKSELKEKLGKEDGEVTVRDVIIEHMKWTFARTALHRGLSSLPSITPREGFLFPMPEFRELFVPREGADSTVGIADALIILLAQVLSLPSLGENELKAHIWHQLQIWPSTLPRTFRHQWTSQNTISTTSLSTIHFLHPSLAAIHLLHRAGIIYFSIYFNFSMTSRKSSPEAVSAARDVLRITQPLIDEASSGRWSVLGALTLAFGPVFVAGQFLKFHLRETPFLVPEMEWLDKECFTTDGLGFGGGMQPFETEEDVELREVERMIDRLKLYLGGVEGRVVEL